MQFVHHPEVKMRAMFQSTFVKFAALACAVAALAYAFGAMRMM
jgi:hypothetical protein